MKQQNPDIGRIKCPFTGQIAPLRRYSTGQRLAYFMSPAGSIKPNLPAGQLYIWQHAEFFDDTDRGQIGSWLLSRGVNLPGSGEPENPRRAEPEQAAPEMVEVVIGKPADPLRDSPEIQSEPRAMEIEVKKPAGGLLSFLISEDDE